MHRLLLLGATSVAALVVSGPAAAWSWPADGDVLRPFALGSDAYAAGQHRGIDVAGADGSPIRAPASGTVSFAGSLPTYGRSLTILTADGYAVTLVHLGSIEVQKGDTVDEGSAVATMGSSGEPEHAAPSVHLGVRVASEAEGYVDPLGLLPPRGVTRPSTPESPAPVTTTAPAASSVPAPPATPPTAAQPAPVSVAAPASGGASAPTSAAASASASPPVAADPAGGAAATPSPESSAPATPQAAARAPLAGAGSGAAPSATGAATGTTASPAEESAAAFTVSSSGERPVAGAAVAASATAARQPLDAASPRGRRGTPAHESVEGRSVPGQTAGPLSLSGTAPVPAAGPSTSPSVRVRAALHDGSQADGRRHRAMKLQGSAPVENVAATRPWGVVSVDARQPAPPSSEAATAHTVSPRDPRLHAMLAAVALVALSAAGILAKTARRIAGDGSVLRHHADLLRQLHAAHRTRVHDGGSGRPRAPSAATRS